MTPLELVRDATTREFVSEDGDPIRLELLPGLPGAEIAAFEAELPCPFPQDVKDLLTFCRGFTGTVDLVDFTGRDLSFEYTPVFPYGVPIAHDGFGNFWVVDLLPTSASWAPIYFACHDAPVILFQSPTIEHFLTELFKLITPPHQSLVDDVHEDRLFKVWRTNPDVLPYEQCLGSSDPQLAAFAQALDPSFQVIDLRNPRVGFGFSWGRYGPNTVVRRFGAEPIFAYQKKQGAFRRLFGTSG